MKSRKSSNWLFLAWAASVIATLGSLYLSEVLHYVPCSLCWYQRIFMYPLVLLLGIATARGSSVIIPYALPLAIIGGGFSVYHIIIQHIPKDSALANACGAVSCAEDYLNWFGFITIPMLALAAFIIIIIALLQVHKLEKRYGY
ncbi:disulfide bond formation protein B [Paenibacillus sp. 598K]|uniref:disulfide oxidoreductase n=1 Tax=Paenibacillus sp. 598K TaxID=1117987 RepID=UPI000FF923FB|nr:disulfide oxidoreductase [Paenibacillus sp. 598K]GBF74489.1 disulfide bond formation protein B [Paenibacillus sp. 598K]